MIVLDASAGIELLRWSPLGETVAAMMADDSETIHVPHLFSVEVAQVLRRLAAKGELDPVRARDAITDLGDLDLIRYSHEPFLDRVWALRGRLTAYDAVYVALAETLEAPLFTLDRRLAATATGVVDVHVLG